MIEKLISKKLKKRSAIIVTTEATYKISGDINYVKERYEFLLSAIKNRGNTWIKG